MVKEKINIITSRLKELDSTGQVFDLLAVYPDDPYCSLMNKVHIVSEGFPYYVRLKTTKTHKLDTWTATLSLYIAKETRGELCAYGRSEEAALDKLILTIEKHLVAQNHGKGR